MHITTNFHPTSSNIKPSIYSNPIHQNPSINFSSTFFIILLHFKIQISVSVSQMAQNDPQHQHQSTLAYQFARASTAAALGGSLQLLSGLTLTGTVIALILATPLLVLFSPVLVPATITLLLLFAGFIISGALGATGVFVLYWMYSYAAGKHHVGADKLDQLANMFASIVTHGKEHHDQGEEDWGVPLKRRLI